MWAGILIFLTSGFLTPAMSCWFTVGSTQIILRGKVEWLHPVQMITLALRNFAWDFPRSVWIPGDIEHMGARIPGDIEVNFEDKDCLQKIMI